MSDQTRKGCQDIWNAFMVTGARFTDHDIPFCPTTATEVPKDIITWTEAKAIYKKALRQKNPDFSNPAFVCFYEDDQKFDGARGIWHDYHHALKVLCHFAGVITPDFSTYQDFPEPLKLYNTYRMRAYGFWLAAQGIPVINNVRWGTPESYFYCFNGIATNSIVAIGTVGGGPQRLRDRKRFEDGLAKMVEILKPHTIIVYGSANYPCFDRLRAQGITVSAIMAQTAAAFERRRQL